jgi:methylthioribose-1-phosphate isomerase
MDSIKAVQWSPDGDAIRIIDQRRLPGALVEWDLRTSDEVCEAIRTLAVRGAPAIGICGAMGVAVAAGHHLGASEDHFRTRLNESAAAIRATRPTAVNLAWAVDRVLARARATVGPNEGVRCAIREEATAILMEDRRMCDMIGDHGASLVQDGARVLTHCNAGALATGGIGTALAPVYRSAQQGKRVAVFASETRPLLQGSRLTAWELARAGIEVTVLTDGMAAGLMAAGSIDICLVGADRIAANGDVANKVGTYALAVLARYHGIPFHVAAPSSTIDAATATGADIVIEQRNPEEVTQPFGVRVAPAGASVHNPAFDVTPAALISGFITDQGLLNPPYHFR